MKATGSHMIEAIQTTGWVPYGYTQSETTRTYAGYDRTLGQHFGIRTNNIRKVQNNQWTTSWAKRIVPKQIWDYK